MFDCVLLLLPPEYNLARARQERAKAERAGSPANRQGHIALAEIFEARASAFGTHGLIEEDA